VRKSKINEVWWEPGLTVPAGSHPNWQVAVQNEGDEACAASIRIMLAIPMIGDDVHPNEQIGRIYYDVLTGETAPTPPNQEGVSVYMASNFTGARAGNASFEALAYPKEPAQKGPTISDTMRGQILVVGA
jgi:hypothetical protein